MNEEKDHGLIPAARVEASLELTLEVSPGLTLEIGPGRLEIMLEPTVKAALMVTYKACVPGPPMNLHPGEE